MSTEPAPAAGSLDAVGRVVVELERHVAAGGWDAPVRLFALVRTTAALERDPALAARLPADVVAAAAADREHLTAVEQDGLPESGSLTELLGRIAWPPTVDGAAVVIERLLDPEREDVRLAVGVLRGGASACAVRTRRHDDDASVAVAPDLAPELVAAVAATLDG